MLNKVTTGARLILGLIFTIFGTNGVLMSLTGKGFIPMPPPAPEMMTVMGGIMAMKYLLPLVKIIEVIAGLFLLSNKFVNLALFLLAPIVVNILGIHLFVDLAGLPMAVFLCVLMALVFKQRWTDFKPILKR